MLEVMPPPADIRATDPAAGHATGWVHPAPQPRVRGGIGRAIDVICSVGSIVTLAALVIVGITAAGGMVSGVQGGVDDTTLTVTYDVER